MDWEGGVMQKHLKIKCQIRGKSIQKLRLYGESFGDVV